MGEKIKDIAEFNIKNNRLKIELNKSSNKDKQFEVHIQGDGFRYDLTVQDFIVLSNTILCAEKLLKKYKDMAT